jgi:hypothetical protein
MRETAVALAVDFLCELDHARPGTAERLLVLVGDQQCDRRRGTQQHPGRWMAEASLVML